MNKKQYLREYCMTPYGIYSHLKYTSKRRHIALLFTKEEFKEWYLKQEQKCYYCKRTLIEINNDIRERQNVKFRLSLDRIDSKKEYSLDNIVLSCYRCNHVKSEYFTVEEMLKIGKILYL